MKKYCKVTKENSHTTRIHLEYSDIESLKEGRMLQYQRPSEEDDTQAVIVILTGS